MPINYAERFWSKVRRAAPDECWFWMRGLFTDGYGVFRLQGKNKRSNRIAYELTHGEIPPGLVVMHSCDNPSCCNPAHLSLGLPRDNSADMVRKGRQASGDRNGSRLHPESRPRGERHHMVRAKMLREVTTSG